MASKFDFQNASFNADNIVIGDKTSIEAPASDAHALPLVGEHCFICYPWTAKAQVGDVAAGLRDRGIALWRDAEAIACGDDWRQEVTEAIETAAAVIVVLSTLARDRTWSEQLAELVTIRDVRNVRPLPLLPVRLDEVEVAAVPVGPAGRTLDQLHRIDLFPDLGRGVDAVVESLAGHGIAAP